MSRLYAALPLLLVSACAQALLAQTDITVAGTGYAAPAAIRVAPGQVVTVFATGLQTLLPNGGSPERATALPLPTSIAGISVTIQQNAGFTGKVPMFSVQQFNQCAQQPGAFTPDCVITALTVQIPYELAVPSPVIESAAPFTTTMAVSESGTLSKSFLVDPVAINAHILTGCDLLTGQTSSTACDPTVTHANGSLVSTSVPAIPGETLVLYVVGLGAVSGHVTTGAATPAPAPPVVSQIGLAAQYLAQGVLPSAVPSAPQTGMRFAGLTPGFVGLYQVNFTVPEPPPSALSCNAGSGLTSNLILSMESAQGVLDRANICVDTGGSSAGVSNVDSTAANIVFGSFLTTGPFTPNTVWFPLGADVSFLAQPVPPGSTGVPYQP